VADDAPSTPVGQPDVPSPEPSDTVTPSRRFRRPRRTILRWAGLILALILLASIPLIIRATRHGHLTPGAAPGGVPSTTPSPPRPAFLFSIRMSGVPVGRNAGSKATTAASLEVQAALSGFYDQAFVDPVNWSRPLPAVAWNAFDPSVRAQAKKDAQSLTLGLQAAQLASLNVETTTGLVIRVLVDQSGHALAADAQVTFDANGVLRSGQAVDVTNRADFLLRPVSGGWVVVGYPDASTKVTSAPPSPSPSGSGSPSAGTSP
jgi:hypothetical protein